MNDMPAQRRPRCACLQVARTDNSLITGLGINTKRGVRTQVRLFVCVRSNRLVTRSGRGKKSGNDTRLEVSLKRIKTEHEAKGLSRRPCDIISGLMFRSYTALGWPHHLGACATCYYYWQGALLDIGRSRSSSKER